MRILLTAATVFEIQPTIQWLRRECREERANVLHFSNVTITVLFGGVGQMRTAYALGHFFGAQEELPDLAIQAGIGGALDPELSLGQVVQIDSERMGDLGAEDSDGELLRLHELGLSPGPPFDDGGVLRVPPPAASLPFQSCAGITTNRATGEAESIARLRRQFPDAQVESMEGAAFLYACLTNGVSCLQLRSISNYVEPRNRDKWEMDKAIKSLNISLQSLLGAFIN
ncbi:futalosine hydrolase [Lewinella sp. W8]|uniref:futalosine hydrolase n=1 Tax=Lewinella sp. W8 TaxID=2528208 RepID=UPI001068C240|nr:futalosine hydrolase [Lewinella sp. W8]MTB50911.1 futalosine hydrolase [Lewinella sp. W8]